MTKFYLLISVFLLSCFVMFSQVEPPVFSENSGFFQSDFNLTLSHPDSQATIIYTLDGSVPHLDNIGGVVYNYKKSYPENPGDPEGNLFQNSFETLTYTNPILVKDRDNDPDVIAAIPTTFYKDPYLPQTPVSKSTVVRARAVVNSEYSPVVTQTYFVSPEVENKYSLPIVSINLDPDKLYSYEDGLNVAGIRFDQWRADNPTETENRWAEANYWKSGGSSELEINFSYFENATEVLNHNAGLRNSGSGSRPYPNRSLSLYAKNGYGASRFNHQFFSDYNYNKFKRLRLRCSGQDAEKTMFRDAFVHELVKHLNVETQAYQPVVMFINSEYNGIYNLRERYTEHYFDRVFGVDEDEVDFLETAGFAGNGIPDLGDEVHYEAMMDYLEANSLQDNSNYDYVTTLLDPIDYTDYYITYIFSGNLDWPHNNCEFWRKRVPYTPDAPYGHDGRWRWLVKDMDFAYGNDSWADDFVPEIMDMLEFATKLYDENSDDTPDGIGWELANRSTLIMRRLLENQNYKNYFINRFADLINTTFKSSRGIELISDIESVLEPEMPQHINRWGMIPTMIEWKDNVQAMKDFAEVRPDIQRNHIKQKFNISNTFTVSTDVSDPQRGYIKINTIDILPTTVGVDENPYPWTGTYFGGVPITITAIPNSGYLFHHWEGTESGTNPQLTLSLNDFVLAKAIFLTQEEIDLLNIHNYDFSTQIKTFPNPFTDVLHFSSETLGSQYSVYSIDGKLMKKDKIDNLTQDFSDLQNGIYLLKLKTLSGDETVYKIVKN